MKTILLLATVLFLESKINAQTWYQIPTGTNKKLNTINFPSSTVGYIGGNDSLLLKSTDGGETWTEINYTGVSFFADSDSIMNLKFVSETIGYMATGPYGGAYKTIDGGLTWTAIISSGNLCFNEGLFFFSEGNGFIGGSGCFQGELIDKISAGTNSPATINSSSWTSEDRVVDIDFYDTDFGLAASAGGRILRTTDGGATWDTISTGQTPGIPLTSVEIIDDTLAYAGYNNIGSGFGILRTSDGGLTWIEDFSSATFFYPAFLCAHEAGNGNFYSGAQPSSATTGLIFENTGVEIWTYYEVDQPIYSMDSYNNNVVFGVGDSGYVVVNQVPANLGINKMNNENANVVVYPNPVKDELFFEIPDGQIISGFNVFIYAISGQLVQEIIYPNDNRIDFSLLTPGLYFINIRGENFNSTTKVVKE